jgi:hypothetical protein
VERVRALIVAAVDIGNGSMRTLIHHDEQEKPIKMSRKKRPIPLLSRMLPQKIPFSIFRTNMLLFAAH